MNRATTTEHARTKPRVTIVLAPDVHATGKRLAATDGRSLSSLIERLILAAADASKPVKVPRPRGK